MLTSMFKPFAIGVVVVDKEPESRIVYVKDLEHLPNLVGNLDNEIETLETVVATREGEVKISLKVADFVEATWLGFDTHVVSPPDVVTGERVLLYREADSLKYYWEALDKDNNLRKLEHVVIAISNTNSDEDKELNLENSYVFIASTRDKYIKLRTNKNDGEPFAYDITLDTKAGNFKVTDDAESNAVDGYVGNRVLLDSAKTKIELRNIDDTKYILDKKNIEEHCKGNFTRVVGGNFSETVTGNKTSTVDGNITMTAKGDSTLGGMNVTLDAKAGANISAAAAVTIKAGGGIAANGGGVGDMVIGSSVDIKGNTNIEGNVNVKGNIIATGLVKAKQVIASLLKGLVSAANNAK